MYYLLVKYSERDNAVSKGQPPPPIDAADVEAQYGKHDDREDPQEKIDKLLAKVKRREKKGYVKDIKDEEDNLPSAVRDALKRLKDEGFVSESGELMPEEVVEQKEKLEAPRKKIEVPKGIQDLLTKVQRVD